MRQLATILFLSILVLGTVYAQDITTGQVAHYPFSGDATDASGNGNDGTVNGATLTTDRFGNTNRAYDFDGTNDFISVSHDASLVPGNTISITMWVNATNIQATTFSRLYNKESAERHLISFQSNGTILAFGLYINGVYSELDVSINPSDYEGNWVHLAAIYDGSFKRIYMNGVEIGNVAASGVLGTSNTGNLAIGSATGGGEYFNGLIDDVRVHNRALSSTEILDLYNQESGPVAYYPFNGNANDESGNGNNGTVNGATLSSDRFGNANSAYSFDGVNDWIVTSADDILDGHQQGTISAWFQTDLSEAVAGQALFNYSTDASANSTSILGIVDDKLYYQYKYESAEPITEAIETVNLNQWQHAVLVSDGTNPAKIYLNGQELTTSFDARATTANGSEWFADMNEVGSHNHFMNIGSNRRNGTNGAFFSGNLDDIRVYSRAISASEIADLYQQESGLIAYYPFNGNANDESGNGNDGTVNGATLTTDRFGNANSAYSFDGVDDFIEVTHNSTLDLPGEFTIAAWAYSEDATVNQPVVFKGIDNNDLRYSTYFTNSNNRFRTVVGNANNYADDLIDEPFNQWLFVVGKYQNGTLTSYVNGLPAGTLSIDYSTVLPSAANVLIGKSDGINHFFDGNLDDIRIYNRALSSSEILDLYYQESGPVAYYPFNGNATDETGNGNDGTENGGVALTTDRFGNANSAYSFDGVDDYISLLPASLNDFNKGSVSSWVKLNVLNPSNVILWKGYSETSSSDYQLLIDDGSLGYEGEVWASLRDDTGMDQSGFGNMAINDGQWVHVVHTWNVTIQSLYINGYSAGAFVSDKSLWNNLDQNIIIGALASDGGNIPDSFWFNGTIDDIRIYNHSLSETEISKLYSNYHPPLNFNIKSGDQETSLGWNSDNWNNLDKVYIYRDLALIDSVLITSDADTLYSDIGLTNGQTYSYYIQSKDIWGNVSISSDKISVSPTIVPEGLVVYYPFEGNANDESGNGHDGTQSGGVTPTTDRFGNANSAYNFDGVDDEITVAGAAPSELLQYNSFTLTGWFQLADTVQSWLLNTPFSWIWVSPDDQSISFHMTDDIIVDGPNSTPNPLNTWTHYAATYDGSTARLNIDGVEVSSMTLDFQVLNLNMWPVFIGQRGGDLYFNGSLDDIRIYNRVLSSAEIDSIYHYNNWDINNFTAFSIPEQNGPANIGSGTIEIEVVFGTDPTSLIANFDLSTGATAEVSSVAQTSGTTSNDFTNPVTYTVTAEDGTTTQDWVVTVTVAPDTGTAVTSFSFPEQTGSATIGSGTVDIEVAFGTDLTNLVATFDLSTGATAEISSVSQTSGTTSNDFTNPVTYTITAEDGITIQNWVVTVTVDDSLVAYYPFNGNANDESGFGNNGLVSGSVILAQDRFGNAGSAYQFQASDGTVALGSLPDFTANGAITISGWIMPMEGGLLAQGIVYSDILNMFFNNNTLDIGFTVTTPEPGLGMDAENEEITYDQWAHVVASYDGLTQKIYINDSLYAIQEGSGFNLVVPASGYFLGSLEGVNGFTGVLDDFGFYNRVLTNEEIAKLYTTGGWNGSTGTAPTSITAFSFPQQTGASTFTSGTIEIQVPIGTDITGLIAEFTLAPGATAEIEGVTQVSGVTSNDFSSPVTYTITAEDGVTTQIWEVIVTEFIPPLSFTTQTLPDDFPFGDASVTASISMDETSGVTVTAYYRSPLASSYDSTPLTNDAGTFEFEIAKAIINIEGLEYYFEAVRNSENISTETTLITFNYSSENSPVIPELSFGGKLNNWRMLSIPVILEDNRLSSMFEAQLGTYDRSKWRIVHYQNDADRFIEYQQDLSVIERGKSYWFNAVTPANIPIGAGKEPGVNPNNPYTMNLQAGWNQIGNPYNIDIDWPAVLTFNSATGVEGLKIYNGGTNLVPSNVLEAYNGAYVRAENAIALSLPVDVLESQTSRQKPYWIEDLSWSVMLDLETPNLSNRINGIGMHPDASDAKDDFDQTRVPRWNKYVDVTFTHPEASNPNFSFDVAPKKEEHFWDFKVETNELSGALQLKWIMEDIPMTKEFRLVDLESGTIINMLDIDYYSWSADDQREFRIVFGDEEFVNTHSGFTGIVLGNNYPNPFNSETVIPYSLYGEDEDYEVEILLFDHLGRTKMSIFKGKKPRGDHLLFVGFGELVDLQDGLYFYQLNVQSDGMEDNRTRKLIIQRK